MMKHKQFKQPKELFLNVHVHTEIILKPQVTEVIVLWKLFLIKKMGLLLSLIRQDQALDKKMETTSL